MIINGFFPSVDSVHEACIENILKIIDDRTHKKEKIVIFIDIDDTLICPKSKTFLDKKTKHLIDDIKKQKHTIKNFPALLSQWRLSRKVRLVNADWLPALERLKKKFKVFGLTKMDTGKFGYIDSVEKWRFNELQKLGIIFSEANLKHLNSQTAKKNNEATFFKGIFFTGDLSKSKTLEKFEFYIQNFDCIVLIDDRKENIHDVQSYCVQKGKSFLGIHYMGMCLIEEKQDLEVYNVQKEYLITKEIWLEDDAVIKQIIPYP